MRWFKIENERTIVLINEFVLVGWYDSRNPDEFITFIARRRKSGQHYEWFDRLENLIAQPDYWCIIEKPIRALDEI